MLLICSGIYNITLNLKEIAKVSSFPGKTMAQDLGRNSSDGQITCKSPPTEVDIECPSPFHRTDWVSQHREKSWEVVEPRGWLVRAVPRGGGPGWPAGSGGSRATWEQAVEWDQLHWGCPPQSHPPGMDGQAEGRKEGRRGRRKERQSQVHRVTAVGERWAGQ